MSMKSVSIASAIAACTAAVGIALGAPASAEPTQQDCTAVDGGQVCGSTGTSATPPVPGNGGVGAGNGQNGPYGPSGNLPPIGN